MKDRVRLNNGTVLLNVHTQNVCAGQPCCIHNPSNHHMATWEGIWDNTYGAMWRKCPHDMLHPDPDDLNYHRQRNIDASRVRSGHQCDGCCQPPAPAAAPAAISARVSQYGETIDG